MNAHKTRAANFFKELSFHFRYQLPQGRTYYCSDPLIAQLQTCCREMGSTLQKKISPQMGVMSIISSQLSSPIHEQILGPQVMSFEGSLEGGVLEGGVSGPAGRVLMKND